MKKLVLSIISISSIAGCAPTYERLREKAATDTNDTLCMVQIVKPQYAQVARDELASRGATCDWERTKLQAQAYIAQQQAGASNDAALMAVGLQLMQNSGPRPLAPMPAPTMTNCRSVYQGSGVVQTSCY